MLFLRLLIFESICVTLHFIVEKTPNKVAIWTGVIGIPIDKGVDNASLNEKANIKTTKGLRAGFLKSSISYYLIKCLCNVLRRFIPIKAFFQPR